MNIIAHNLMAMNVQRQLGIHSNSKIKTTEKMSSGYKINRAADDAAGLAISEKMRRQIRGLNQASENIVDGISFVQVADGAINEVQDILQRMNELSVQAANGTYTAEDRSFIQEEITQLIEECDRIFKKTEFNEQKIWQAPYIPYVSGIPRELKIYNESIDANGNIIYGGIIWGTDRYRWDEIDPNMYDTATGKFNPGTYTIDVPAAKLDVEHGNDVYEENGNNVTLKLAVSEEGLLTSISRECGWEANQDGILMDGVLYKWTDLENSFHNKTFDPNNIQAGIWGFNTYNGTHIWFEIPEGTEELSEVIDGVNGSILDNLSWETQITSIQSDFAVGIVYGEDAAALTAPTIEITDANYDKISEKYFLHADNTGVWITTTKDSDPNNPDGLGKETWEQLGFENGSGEFIPPHDFTNHIYYEYPAYDQPDNHAAVTTGGYWHYTESDTGYVASQLPELKVQFMVLEEASKQGIINGIDGVVIDTEIHTPSTVSNIDVGIGSGKVSLLNTNAKLSFEFHKDIIGRDFGTQDASLGSGKMAINGDNIVLDIANEDINGLTHSASFVAKESYGEVRNKIKELLKGNGGTLTITLEYDSENVVELQYQIDSLTDVEWQDIYNGSTPDYYVEKVCSDIFGGGNNGTIGTVVLAADGMATQTIGRDRSTTDSLGFADTNNNKATYANFSTKIKYTRQLDIQASGEAGEYIEIKYDVLNAAILGLTNVSVMDQSSAGSSIGIIKNAMQITSEQRSLFGAYQNRLEHAKKSNDNAAENTTSAESRIRDADMAKEVTENAMKNVLMQAGQSVLAQANQNNATILQLLQ